MARSNVLQFPTAQKIEHYQNTQQAADFLNVSQPYFDELLNMLKSIFSNWSA